jgi:putative peptidoglycan lipid II flippase
VNVGINFAVSLALYQPFGIAGLVIGTVIGNAGMMAGQAYFLRRQLHGLEGRRTGIVTAQVLGASLLLALVSYGVWYGLDAALGRGLAAQIVSVVGGITAGFLVYAAAVTAMRVPEAHQIRELVQNRFRSRREGGAS